MPALSSFDRIDVSDDVGNRDVRRRQFFHKARIPADPFDVYRVAMQFDHLSPVSANGMKGIVVNFRAFDDGNRVVEKIRQLANNSTLRLPAQTEQNQVVL